MHELNQLIEKFDRNLTQYKSTSYDEANVRVDFIDKFFTILGWDVSNENGYSENYREVVREAKVITLGKPKNPDYSFRIGGVRKFFVEAKKPSIDIKQAKSPAFQIRRYAYTANLPLSILTNFQEFAVYDTRIKPAEKDDASVGRIFYCRYGDYEKEWDYLKGTFSQDAILTGSFDKYISDKKRQKGTSTVDKEFLKTIDKWRVELAKAIARNNASLQTYDINYAVQKLIDRIIFLRFAEDHNIEEYGSIKKFLETKEQIYSQLDTFFKRADAKYNSSLFKPEDFISHLVIPDKILHSIISELYYPKCPYEFSVMPIEILGSIYEKFLGKTIRLTASHQAKVEEKPEVRKAGGVYYTPQYIVDYIVENTVGKKLKGRIASDFDSAAKIAGMVEKKVNDVHYLRVLDPACGSGSFLVRAYDYLLRWYLDQYTKAKSVNKNLKEHRIYQINNDQDYQLSIRSKQDILTRHIYGVDIDRQAVEVTRLSLLLKLMEGESQQTSAGFLRFDQARLLPDLSQNIKCGNSLIGSDFYEGAQLSLLDDQGQARKLNTFDWQDEFKDIFQNKGFDCVIGNPPYVRQETLGHNFKKYAEKKYKTYHGIADIYVYFIERGVNLLNASGRFAYIVANKWLRANYGEPLRNWLKEQKIDEIVDFGDLPVFGQVTTYPCILTIVKGKPKEKFHTVEIPHLQFKSLQESVKKYSFKVTQNKLLNSGWMLVNDKTQKLIEKLKSENTPLGKYVDGKIYRGVLTGLNEAFVISEDVKNRLIKEDPKSEEVIKPFLLGKEIKRYQTLSPENYLIFFPRGFTNMKRTGDSAFTWLEKTYPSIAKHLADFEKKAKQRYDKGDHWWELRACDYYSEFEKPKIIWGNLAIDASFSYDTSGFFINAPGCILPADKYILACLNSKVSWWYLKLTAAGRSGGFLEAKPIYVDKIPIPKISDIGLKDDLVILVNKILSFNEELKNLKTSHDQKLHQQKIEILDKQIDRLVYQLYKLTPEEIKIVEGDG